MASLWAASKRLGIRIVANRPPARYHRLHGKPTEGHKMRWITTLSRDGDIYIVTPKGYLKGAVFDGHTSTIATRELVA